MSSTRRIRRTWPDENTRPQRPERTRWYQTSADPTEQRSYRSPGQPDPCETGRDEQGDVQQELAAAEQIAVAQSIPARPGPCQHVAGSERPRGTVARQRERDTASDRSECCEPGEWPVNRSTAVQPPGAGSAGGEEDDRRHERRSGRIRRGIPAGVPGSADHPSDSTAQRAKASPNSTNPRAAPPLAWCLRARSIWWTKTVASSS
jgi:hypothetical protein